MRPVILGAAAVTAIIALIINLTIPAYTPDVDVSHLRFVTILNGTTLFIRSISSLVSCRTYVQTNVPNTTGLTAFNDTALVANATSALGVLAASLQNTGVVTAASNGTVLVNATTLIRYEKRYLTLGNGSIYHVYLPPQSAQYHITTNGTFTFTLDGWTPTLYPGGGAYNATEPIFDVQRSSKIQSAPVAMFIQAKSFSYTAINLATSTFLTVGTIVQVTRDVNIW
jgi:hypothetical protein